MRPWKNISRWFKRLNASTPEALDRLTNKFEAEFAQRRLIEQELAHLASFAELDPNIILETDLQGRILYQNIVAEEEFGDLHAFPNHPLLEGLAAIVKVFQIEKKKLLSRPVKIGQKVFAQQITLIENGSRLRSYVTDVTELKRLDQLKTDFVNMVSHELRTPLTSLQAVIRMLHADMLGPLNEDQKKALGMAVSSIDRLGRLINNLLDVSKIEAGKMELHRQWVDVAEVLDEVHAGFSPLAKERGLEVRFQTPVQLPFVYVDRDKVVEVLTNLVQNAMKFTPRGFVELSAQVDADALTCTVADSGPGISAADLPKLFGQFQQIGQHAGSAEKGTGLGLSICKGIVELHQGKIWAESQEGQGSRFIFKIPRLTPEELFQSTVRELFEEAAAASKPLAVATFAFQGWESLVPKIGAAESEALLDRLEKLVKSASRRETDPVVRTKSQVWLALTGADLAAAREIAERVEQGTLELEFQKLAHLPAALDYRLIAFPENAAMVEQLLDLTPTP